MSNITLVTGIWDIGRGELTEGWSRSYQHYLDKFEQLLKVDENLICLLYTSPSPRDRQKSRMPSSA